MNQIIKPRKALHGTIRVPGDKSISHRAVMFGALAEGTTEITGFLDGDDCRSTIACFRQMGIAIKQNGDRVTVCGKGLHGLVRPVNTLDVGNSGTTIRLMSGILAAQGFDCEITGDASIQKRPMGRVCLPLSQMGANVRGKEGSDTAPLQICGTDLHGITYDMPVASAQVKSAILLAGLYAKGETVVREPYPSRDHTERMLSYLGANICTANGEITIQKADTLTAHPIQVPGDISSAAFFIVAALIVPDSHVIIENVGINETRTGILDVLAEMGGDIRIRNHREASGEPIADIEVRTSRLRGITFGGAVIPRMIDEIPILAVAALFAEGETIVKDAQELKVKESNRIRTMGMELGKMGAALHETDDGMIIHGGQTLHGALTESHNDHRVAMSMAVAGLMAAGETEIAGAECAAVSFPGFFEALHSL